MNLLIIGGGGREHAIAWKASQSEKIKNIYVVPGNPGIAKENKIEVINIKDPDIEDYIKIAKNKKIDLTVVGPEAPLVDGIVDEFKKHKLLIFGPNKLASKLECSKDFCKKILNSGNVLTAKHESFTDPKDAISYIDNQQMPLVIKLDGLAAGKGVFIVQNHQEAIDIFKHTQFPIGFTQNANRRFIINMGAKVSLVFIKSYGFCGTSIRKSLLLGSTIRESLFC